MSEAFPGLPVSGADARQVAAVVNRLGQGKLNCTGSVALAANAATTVVADPRASGSSVVLVAPRTANAAAELGNGSLYIAASGKGSFTIAHANNAQTDRLFDYVVIG